MPASGSGPLPRGSTCSPTARTTSTSTTTGGPTPPAAPSPLPMSPRASMARADDLDPLPPRRQHRQGRRPSMPMARTAGRSSSRRLVLEADGRQVRRRGTAGGGAPLGRARSAVARRRRPARTPRRHQPWRSRSRRRQDRGSPGVGREASPTVAGSSGPMMPHVGTGQAWPLLDPLTLAPLGADWAEAVGRFPVARPRRRSPAWHWHRQPTARRQGPERMLKRRPYVGPSKVAAYNDAMSIWDVLDLYFPDLLRGKSARQALCPDDRLPRDELPAARTFASLADLQAQHDAWATEVAYRRTSCAGSAARSPTARPSSGASSRRCPSHCPIPTCASRPGPARTASSGCSTSTTRCRRHSSAGGSASASRRRRSGCRCEGARDRRPPAQLRAGRRRPRSRPRPGDPARPRGPRPARPTATPELPPIDLAAYDALWGCRRERHGGVRARLPVAGAQGTPDQGGVRPARDARPR